MQTKNFSIALDMVLPLPFHPFEVVEGDTGNVLHVLLQNNGVPLELSDCQVMVVFSSSAGSAIQDTENGLVMGAAVGTFTLSLLPASYGPGNVQADVQVYSGVDHGVLITSKRFDFRCRRTLISEEIMRANTTYPPLIRATREAQQATQAALSAIESLGNAVGEMNVQTDWAETDMLSDAYIQNKPSAFQPSAHAAVHATGGTDPITPLSIGAATSGHTHTPAAIGAEQRRLQFANVVVAAANFTVETTPTYADFPYRAAVALAGVLAAMTPEVVFGVAEATSGSFAPVAACYDGGVYVYASEALSAAITIPTIILWKAVG